MGNGRYILDHAYVQAGGLQSADSGFTAGAGALYIDLNGLHAMLHSQAGGGFSRGLRGKGSGFPGASEAQLTGAGPGDRIALRIGNGDNGIVKCGLDMGSAAFNVLALTAAAYCTLCALLCCHGINPSLLFLVRHGLSGTFAGSGVGLRALASYRKALAVTDAAVTADLNEALDIERQVAAQVAFHVAVLIDIVSQLRRIVFGKVTDPDIGIHAGSGADIAGGLAADAINMGQRNFDPLVSGQVNA